MDNCFILSSKVGDKWTKVTSDMTSFKLGTCIHIVVELSSFGNFSQIPYQQPDDYYSHNDFHKEFTVILLHTELSSQ
jgi:hypothetical protein